MTQVDQWVRDFIEAGPDYPAQEMSLADMQTLLLKAAIGADLPHEPAEDLSALAPFLSSDPRLMAMTVGALLSPHPVPLIEGTREHRVIEGPSVLMIGPVLVDLLVSGVARVVMHDVDWPLLIWAYLAQAEKLYDLRFDLVFPSAHGVIASPSDKSGLQNFGSPQAMPVDILFRLEGLAARTHSSTMGVSRSGLSGR